MGNKNRYKSKSLFDMQFITSSISTTLVLLLLGLVVFFVLTAHNMSVYVRENISFSILISDDMKETSEEAESGTFCEAVRIHLQEAGAQRTDRSDGDRSRRISRI